MPRPRSGQNVHLVCAARKLFRNSSTSAAGRYCARARVSRAPRFQTGWSNRSAGRWHSCPGSRKTIKCFSQVGPGERPRPGNRSAARRLFRNNSTSARNSSTSAAGRYCARASVSRAPRFQTGRSHRSAGRWHSCPRSRKTIKCFSQVGPGERPCPSSRSAHRCNRLEFFREKQR